MKEFDTHELRLVLNYDTYKQAVFTNDERCKIHHEISRLLRANRHNPFPFEITKKIWDTILKIEKEKYTGVEGVWQQDDTEKRLVIIKQ